MREVREEEEYLAPLNGLATQVFVKKVDSGSEKYEPGGKANADGHGRFHHCP